MEDELITVAKLSRDALLHADSVKTRISLAMGANTPVICLACTKLNRFGTDCTDGGDMYGEVDQAWQLGSKPETPLVEICSKFVSVRAVHDQTKKV